MLRLLSISRKRVNKSASLSLHHMTPLITIVFAQDGRSFIARASNSTIMLLLVEMSTGMLSTFYESENYKGGIAHVMMALPISFSSLSSHERNVHP